MKIENNKVIYSWSRLNSYSQGTKQEGCLYSYYRTYIEKDRGIDNFFSLVGLLYHNTIEKYNKQEIFDWDLEDEIEKGFLNIQHPAPFKKMQDAYHRQLREFFLEGDFSERFKDYTILESEEAKEFNIGSVTMRGFPDMVCEHKDYGFSILDFKSSRPYQNEKLSHNIMQMYIYSIPIYEKYGRYPENLIYYYFREKEKKEYVYPFDMNKLEETKQWVLDTIAAIEQHTDWKPRCSNVDVTKDFFSQSLCSHRNTCAYRVVNKS